MNAATGHSQFLRLTAAAPDPGQQVAALFISGGNPANSLEEICAWGDDAARLQGEMRLCLLPSAPGSGRLPCGVLVILPEGCAPPASPRARPYKVLAGRMYLPVDARLEPPVNETEFARLLGEPADGGVYVFHPGAGLCRFGVEDIQHLADLLDAPVRTPQTWVGAHPGTAFNGRLRSVRLELPGEGMEDLFGDAARDIGADAGKGKPLPPVPGEEAASGLTAAAGRKLREWAARSVLGLCRPLPRTASARTWLDRLEDWANRHIPSVSDAMNEDRQREINRLLHLLKENPDAGLRHAIPLAGLLQGRGRAQPTGRLSAHNTDFSLNSLRGGQAADPWALGSDLQARLRERYRELAGEEARLGRHRRAAYIHAQLLGDLSSAAACLKAGQHFHEAAVLYRDHLRRPVEAANCFAAGGEWAEALALYEKERRHLGAAAMYEAMGEPGRAAASYRQEVQRLLAASDFLAAADLLETRLAAPDEAFATLRAGWPRSKQAARCLEKAFEELGTRGAHAQAAGLLAELAAETTLPVHTLPLARTLATTQQTYPDESVRDTARDLARVKMASRLAAAHPAEVRSFVEIFARLAPQDPLLLRDGNRYLAARQDQEKRRAAAAPANRLLPSSPAPPPLPGRRSPRPTHKFSFSEEIRWMMVQAVGGYLYVAGYHPELSLIVLARSMWSGESFHSITWHSIGSQDLPGYPQPLLLTAPWMGNQTVVLALADSTLRRAPALTPRRFPDSVGPWGEGTEGGQPTWWPLNVVTATYAADGNLWLLRAEDGNTASGLSFLLACHTSDGALVSQLTPPLLDLAAAANWQAGGGIHLVSTGSGLLLGCGNRLLIRPGGAGEWTELEFESSIIGLVSTPRLARAGCAVCLTDGVSLVWLDSPGTAKEVLSDVERPLAGFTRLGTLVVLCPEDGEGVLFETVRGEARSIGNFTHQGGEAFAMTGTDEREGFAVFESGGHVQVYTAA